MLVSDIARAEGEQQAAAILAVNLGSHGKKQDVERAIRDLTQSSKEKPDGGLLDAQKNLEKMKR